MVGVNGFYKMYICLKLVQLVFFTFTRDEDERNMSSIWMRLDLDIITFGKSFSIETNEIRIKNDQVYRRQCIQPFRNIFVVMERDHLKASRSQHARHEHKAFDVWTFNV